MTNETNKLPAEVGEKLYEVLGHEPEICEDICAALAPLWPKPVQPSADVQRIAEKIGSLFSRWEKHGDVDCSDGAITAILAREFAAKDAEIARLQDMAERAAKDGIGHYRRAERAEEEVEHERQATASLGRSFDEMRARAERAEAELAATQNELRHKSIVLTGVQGERDNLRAAIDAAMKKRC